MKNFRMSIVFATAMFLFGFGFVGKASAQEATVITTTVCGGDTCHVYSCLYVGTAVLYSSCQLLGSYKWVRRT